MFNTQEWCDSNMVDFSLYLSRRVTVEIRLENSCPNDIIFKKYVTTKRKWNPLAALSSATRIFLFVGPLSDTYCKIYKVLDLKPSAVKYALEA